MFATVLLLLLSVIPVIPLLHPVPSAEYDNITKELVANMSQLRQEVKAFAIREQEFNRTIARQQTEFNRTIALQQDEFNRKITDQQMECTENITYLQQEFRRTVALQQQAFNRTTTIQQKNFNRTIAFLKEDLEFLNQKLLSRDSEHNKTIGLLKHSFTLREQDMNKTLEFQQHVISELQNNMEGMKILLNDTKEEATQKANDNLRDVHNLMNRLNQSVQDEIRDVAFTVSKSSYGNLGSQKVIYDKIITNVGNGYSTHTGVFTCPRDGVYVFTWSTMSRTSSQNCDAYIYRNGEQLLMTKSFEANGGWHEVASNTAVLSLTVGDTVWIQTSSCDFFYGYPYTAFSGWKL